MTTRQPAPSPFRPTGAPLWQFWLDALAILVWGFLLIRFWLTGKINILLHPDYMWLANVAGICLVLLGVYKLWQVLRLTLRGATGEISSQMQHMNLFPKAFSSGLLLGVALFGLQFSPRAFTSDVALQRGVTDTLTMTRSQPQAFRGGVRPEQRTLVEWVRTLSVYPEPDAYAGQPAKVEGFVIHSPNLPDNYLTLSRFVITCCAADVYPVGMPVKLSGSRSQYPPDQWFRVEGEMISEMLDGQRQLVIQSKTLTSIPEPEIPYDY